MGPSMDFVTRLTMPRAKLFRTSRFAYHVSVRTNNREPFPIPLRACWNILTSALAKSQKRYGVEVHAFLLMGNHFHLLLSTPHENLDRFMSHFSSTSAVRLAYASGRSNHLFGTRYKPTVLETAYSLAYVFKYIYRNPVRAGICGGVEEYEFSTFITKNVPFKLLEGVDAYWQHIPVDSAARLRWLNIPTPKEQEDLLRRALRRSSFQFPKGNGVKRHLRELRLNYGVESNSPETGQPPFGKNRDANSQKGVGPFWE